jgi:adenine-specific DNA methylase
VIFGKEDDIERENLIKSMLYKNLQEWRDAGFIPEMEIAEGYNTNQPIRDRGWTHWSHLFNPRQLFMNSIVTRHSKEYPFMNLGLASVYDRSARTNRWHSGEMKVEQTFDDQAIKPLFNYGSRAGSRYCLILEFQNVQ